MARSYRVFLGAPTVKDLRARPETTYNWQTITPQESPPPLTLPPATLAAASRRISLLYQNIIFRDTQDDEQEESADDRAISQYDRDSTAITWAPTPEEQPDSIAGPSQSRTGISFLRSTAGGTSRHRSLLYTQDTHDTGSLDYSDASSIARFPTFHFNLHALTPLSALVRHARAAPGKGARKVAVLVAVLEAEGPDAIRIKKGSDAGSEVGLLKLIIGDEDGVVCKLTAWREVADVWGGIDPDPASVAVKKGDIVLLENVLAAWDAAATGDDEDAIPVHFTASPNLKSKMEICYRTLPSMPQDHRFRPDLRLGFSDAAVRKVAAVVSWFEVMAGLPTR